jgi:starvation-inducible DNA-binding protein
MSTTTATRSTTAATPVVAALNQVLADSYVLMSLTHAAHWNVEGAGFFSLHKAFHEEYEDLFEAIDEIAERIRALDAYPVGGLKHFAAEAGIEEPKTVLSAKDYVAALVVAHEKTIADLVTMRNRAGDANDLETQDLGIKRIQTHQQTVWMLKSYLK